jgi:hypothetical protein
MDPDPDPGDPKTDASGSGTLLKRLKIEPCSKIYLRRKTEPCRDMDPHNGGLKAENGALEGP